MLSINFDTNRHNTYRMMLLGAHCDDIEIGCGGTILQLIEKFENINLIWVVFSSNQQRKKEALESANNFLKRAKKSTIIIEDFDSSFFPYIGQEIKKYFERLKKQFSPNVIFTHYRNDLHQDHRLISELTWNTFRDHLILEYEIPKYDGDFGSPNLFVHVGESICRRKIRIILETYQSQRTKSWFTADTFMAVLRLRGIESNAPSNYAEGFYCKKMVLSC